jgi:hypothetical protein
MCAFKRPVEAGGGAPQQVIAAVPKLLIAAVPKVVITEKQVRAELGKGCPEPVITEIMKSENPKGKVGEVKDALAKIEEVAGEWSEAAVNALGEPGVARLFIGHTAEFVEIAKLSEYCAEGAFEALGKPGVAGLFEKHVSSFIELAKASREWSDEAFGALEDPGVRKLFEGHMKTFLEIARAVGQDEGASRVADAFKALGKEEVGKLFAAHKQEFIDIAQAAGMGAPEAFRLLEDEAVRKIFTENPSELINNFASISGICGKGKEEIFESLNEDGIREMFASTPETIIKALTEIRGEIKMEEAFMAMGREHIRGRFLGYCEGKEELENVVVVMLADVYAATELGWPLDYLHADTPKRMEYLKSLSDMQVFALLLSEPDNFYTSTNHLLFDRLKSGIGEEGIVGLLKKHKLLGTQECTNLVFRAINYDRFYGRGNSIFKEGEVVEVIDSILRPLEDDVFNGGNFFLVANAVRKIRDVPGAGEVLSRRLAELKKRGSDPENRKKIERGVEYLLYELHGEEAPLEKGKLGEILELGEKAYFDPSLYSREGKLQVLQVFDKEDTGKDHWHISRKWFGKYGRPKKGKDGELIYETPTARIVLFMGDTKEENADFVSKELKRNPNMVITFRGHSYSLEESFPKDVFKGTDGHVLFIPGSCGSSGDIASYIEERGGTDLRFISNTSTGRGQVTNTLVDLAVGNRERTEFGTLIKKGEKKIRRWRGDMETIQVWTPGEALLNYVYR